MLDHARAQDLAASSIDFELTADEHSELDAHLAACPACRAYADGLRRDARMLAERPRAAAPERVARRIAGDPRPAGDARFRFAAATVGIVVVVVAVVAGTGGLQFGAGPGVEPTGIAAASPTPTTGPTPVASQGPTASVGPSTPGPRLPTAPWEAVEDQPAFDPVAAAPPKDTSSPRPLPCTDCGDTSVQTRSVAVRAAVATADGIVAVGHGCLGGEWVTCQADIWRSADGVAWQAVPHDATLDAGSGTPVNRPTGMVDVVAGPRGLVAGGAVTRDGRSVPTVWTSVDGRSWLPIELDHAGTGTIGALAVGPDTLVAVGRARTDGGPVAAAWVSTDGTTWTPAEVNGAAVGRFDGDDQDVAGMFDVTWAGDRFVAVGAGCSSLDSCQVAAWTSADGRSWASTTTLATIGRMRSVATLGSILVAVGDDGTWEDARGRAWSSTDGTDWIPAAIGSGDERPATLRAVVAVGAGAIAAGDGYAVRSADGRTWTRSDDGVLARGTVFGLAAVRQGVIATGQGAGTEVDDGFELPPAVWLLPYR